MSFEDLSIKRKLLSGEPTPGTIYDGKTEFIDLCEAEISAHPEFSYRDSGWFSNHDRNEDYDPGAPEFKIRIRFNNDQLCLLDGCPFKTKYRPDVVAPDEFDFCGFVFPQTADELRVADRWAQKFPDAELYTYGKIEEGLWIPGEFVRKITG